VTTTVLVARLYEAEHWEGKVSDEVNLVSAIPTVTWSRNSYVTGDTAQVNYVIPTVADTKGNGGYFLTVSDMNTNRPIAGFDRKPLEQTQGSATFTVTASMFSTDSATCQNRLRAEIYSTLIIAARKDASVQASVDISRDIGDAPQVTQITFDKAEYIEGDTPTVTWTTSGTVSKVHVTAFMTGTKVFDQDMTGNSVTIPAVTAGVLQVEVTAYNDCQPSDVSTSYTTVGDVGEDLCSKYPQLCEGDSSDIGIPWQLILVLAGAALILVGFLGGNYIPLSWRLILLLIGLGLLLFGVLSW